MDDDTTTGSDYGTGYDSGSSLDTQYGAVDSYGGSGEYTTESGNGVTVDDHSGDGYADVYGAGYGDSTTYGNYQDASETSNELYQESTQAYINGDEEASQNLTYASQDAGNYANDQYSAYMGTGDYAPEQATTEGYTADSGDDVSGYGDTGYASASTDDGYSGTYDTSSAGEEMQTEEDDYLSS